MTSFKAALAQRFSEENITKIDEVSQYNIDILLVKTHFDRDFTLLTTSGLSAYQMPFREEENNAPHIELCFALPSYWDLTFTNENSSWVIEKMKFLVDFVLTKKTHFWDGHTMPNANPNGPFSNSMKQNHLFFSKAILYENELNTFEVEGKTVHLIFLIPLFQKELEHKFSRGIMAIKRKLAASNHCEILDDFREVVIKKRFGIL
jgi:hypothetical protein